MKFFACHIAILCFYYSLRRYSASRSSARRRSVGEQRISGGHVFHPVLQLDRTGGPDLLVHRDLQVEGPAVPASSAMRRSIAVLLRSISSRSSGVGTLYRKDVVADRHLASNAGTKRGRRSRA